eukprot:jgi/Mesvir1/1034/Mv17560-RA.1
MQSSFPWSSPRARDDKTPIGVHLLVFNVSHSDILISLRPEFSVASANADVSSDEEPSPTGMSALHLGDSAAIRMAHPGEDEHDQDTDMDSRFVCPIEYRYGKFDVVPKLTVDAREITKNTLIARPKFSKFQRTSQVLLEMLSKTKQRKIAVDPVEAGGGVCFVTADSPSTHRRYPVGLSFADYADTQDANCYTWNDFHYRSGVTTGHEFMVNGSGQFPFPVAVHFPLLATVIPLWLERCNQIQPLSRKVVFLVSGAGTPRNASDDVRDNSTEGTAKLMAAWLKMMYARLVHGAGQDVSCSGMLDYVGLEVETVHSEGIWRYDENVAFVNAVLRPRIEQLRSFVTQTHQEGMKQHFHLTVCLTDGAPARVAAINNSTREFRPEYAHMWQLKSFWDRQVVDEEDVDFHLFATIETTPAVPVGELDPGVQELVAEMDKYKRDFEAVRDSDEPNEMQTFWLRKTGKAVLAVLCVHKTNPVDKTTKVIYFRGINLEVSMPTGTLCSERNAMGNALASDQTLKRHDMKMIAVLSIPLAKFGVIRAWRTSRGSLGGATTGSLGMGPSSIGAASVATTVGSAGSVGSVPPRSIPSMGGPAASMTYGMLSGGSNPLGGNLSGSNQFSSNQRQSTLLGNSQVGSNNQPCYPNPSEPRQALSSPVRASSASPQRPPPIATSLGGASGRAAAGPTTFATGGSNGPAGPHAGGGVGFASTQASGNGIAVGSDSSSAGITPTQALMVTPKGALAEAFALSPVARDNNSSAGPSFHQGPSSTGSPEALPEEGVEAALPAPLSLAVHVSETSCGAVLPCVSEPLRIQPPATNSWSSSMAISGALHGSFPLSHHHPGRAAEPALRHHAGAPGGYLSTTPPNVCGSPISELGTPVGGGTLVPRQSSGGDGGEPSRTSGLSNPAGYSDGLTAPNMVPVWVPAPHLNPLSPCGACTEWLRKVADVNPDFKVITFQDLDCRDVYVRNVG